MSQPDALLTEGDLSVRWKMSCKTLQSWRQSGKGPKYRKIGRNVRYQLNEVIAFENERIRAPRG